jgi:hypothetical protein
MASLTTRPHDTTSPITKLPPELLEKVLSEVVRCVVPAPTHNGPIGHLTNRVMAPKDITATLGFRFTSRAFRDTSHRALAHVIGSATFDIASKKSISSLKKLSKNRYLAPWITKLTFTCQVVHDGHPHRPKSHPLSNDRLQLLTKIRSWRQLGTLTFFRTRHRGMPIRGMYLILISPIPRFHTAG